MTSNAELHARSTRLENDVASIYMLTGVQTTLADHSRRLDGIDQTLIEHTRRFDEHDRRFDQIDETLAEVLRRLPEAS